ncbi:hypothetical protein BV898_13375 [Hypsibius exemplaris]|uniref:ZP domain-containing protein n=1 Tax=Hypsibius exemplaris TaxID=2072580 RepID=A0A1W0WAZ6_HYPEX|nr:hypothetical protein BV898_13375 [Hypsibius exemplaris]
MNTMTKTYCLFLFLLTAFLTNKIHGKFVIKPSNSEGSLFIKNITDNRNGKVYFVLAIDHITLTIVEGGQYPIDCDSDLSVINSTASNPDELLHGKADFFPANGLGKGKTNDAVPSLISLNYVAVDPATGKVIVELPILNGTQPSSNQVALKLCANRSGDVLSQQYSVSCKDVGGSVSNSVQFLIRFPQCDFFVNQLSCKYNKCRGRPVPAIIREIIQQSSPAPLNTTMGTV